MSDGSRRGTAARRALRHPQFRLLALGLFVSNLGTWIFQVAFIAYLYGATHSTAWVAAAAFARMVPTMALAPLAGALADRLDRRKLLVASDAARAVLMVGLAAAVAANAAAGIIVALAALGVVLGSAYMPAISAELPALLGEDDLAAGNATDALLWNVTMFLGPALGGALLLATSASTAILVNAVSFAFSATVVRVALAGRRYDEGAQLRESESLMQSTAAGARILLGDRVRRAVTFACLGGYVVYGTLTVLLVALAETRLHAGGHGYGLLIGAFGAGGVAAAFVAERGASSRRAATSIFLGLVAGALPMCLLGLVGSLSPAIVLVFVVGLALCVVDITGITILQRLTPPEALGRAFGLFDALNYATTLLGVLVAPVLVQAIGIQGAVITVAVGVPVLCAWAVPALMTADRVSTTRAGALAQSVRLLATTEMFAACSRSALERLAATALPRTAQRDEVVVRQGDRADDLYVVVDGRLAVTDATHVDPPLRVLSTGDAFGEIGLVTGGRRTATVTATKPTELLRIPGEVFMDCVQATPPMAESVNGLVTARLSHVRQRNVVASVPVGSTP